MTEATGLGEDVVAPDDTDYGPRGYLPPRAARRARKIILREPMGLQWAIAAVVAGLLVLVAGVLLLTRSGSPGPPFIAAGDIAAFDPRGAGDLTLPDGQTVLVLRGAGGVTVFAAPGDNVEWCADRSRLTSPTGAVWQPDGRLVGGSGSSLTRLPSQVHDGTLYVDPGSPPAPLAPRPDAEPSGCPTP